MNLNIRPASPDDAGWITGIYAPIVRDTTISFELSPPSEDEMRRRIGDTLHLHPWLAAERDGKPLGYAYASQHRTREAYRWSCDVTVYVAPESHRQNVGSSLYTDLLAILTAQGFRSAFAGIALPNAASVALHERVGFVQIGTYRGVGFKLGAWHDVGWWQRSLTDSSGMPAEPVPFQDYRKSLGW